MEDMPYKNKPLPSCVKIDGKVESNPTLIANSFNYYFSGAVRRLTQSLGFATSLLSTNISSTFSEIISPPKTAFKFVEITEQFTSTQLRKLKTGKSAGLDNMPGRLMKDAADIIAGPLTRIFNLSLAEGHVPSEWKSARVIPLLKSGEPDNMDNYRPISILPVASKIMEKAVHVQLSSFLTNNQLLSPYQCGFRKGHSTETAVIGLTDTIRRNMDHARLTGAVFIDLSKAFDTIDHSKLLSKLRVYGIADTELLWFTNYLANRRQLVQYRNVSSDYSVISSGVPQGSILGPLLFVIFVNDLPSTACCSVMMYADDTVLFFASNSVSEIEDVINHDLHLLQTWLLDNNLFLNKKKTEFVLFGTSARLSRVGDCTINIGDHAVKRVLNFKYLGVVLDDAL